MYSVSRINSEMKPNNDIYRINEEGNLINVEKNKSQQPSLFCNYKANMKLTIKQFHHIFTYIFILKIYLQKIVIDSYRALGWENR